VIKEASEISSKIFLVEIVDADQGSIISTGIISFFGLVLLLVLVLRSILMIIDKGSVII